MTLVSHDREVLSSDSLFYKLERLDREIGKSKDAGTLDSDFKLDASLMGSSYALGLAKAEEEDLEYEVGDIDLYTPEDSVTQMHDMRKVDQATEDVSVINLTGNWNQGPLVECFSGIPDEYNFLDEDRQYAEEALEESLENPFRTVYEGDNLEVSLTDPEVYEATKSPEKRGQESHQEQMEIVNEILNESSDEFYDTARSKHQKAY